MKGVLSYISRGIQFVLFILCLTVGQIAYAAPTTLATGLANPGSLVADEADLYFAEDVGKLQKISKKGGAITTLTDTAALADAGALRGINALALDATHVFAGFGGYTDYQIMEVPKTGGDTTSLTSFYGGQLIGVIGTVAYELYYSNGFSIITKQSLVDGTKTSVQSAGFVRATTMDSRYIYYIVYGSQDIYRFDTVTEESTLLLNESTEGALFLDDANVYWTAPGVITRVPKSGGAPVTLLNAETDVHAYASDNQYVYYQEDNALKRMPATGGTPEVLATGVHIASLVVDAASLYWTDSTNGQILTMPKALSVTCTPGTDGCNSNVMFLPGVEASRLYASDTLRENQIWEPKSPLGIGDVPNLDMSNANAANTVYSKEKDIIDIAYKNAPISGGYKVYSSFINQMNSLVTNGTIAAWEPIAYDWRLDYEDLLSHGRETGDGKIYYRGTNAATTSDPYIVQQLKSLASTSRTHRVTIIAHSNGGLLAKALLTHPDYAQYVDTVVLVATPQLGTPQAIGGLLHGFDQALPKEELPIFLADADARYLGQSMPMAYNLLPSATYLQHVVNPVVSFDSLTLADWAHSYGQLITTQNQLRIFMTDTSRTKPTRTDILTPEIVNPGLYLAAIGTHAELDNWTPPAGVQLVTIAGWGNDTVSGIAYKKTPQLSCTLKAIDGSCVLQGINSVFGYEPQFVIDGDGTVAEPSAQWTNGAPAKQYWVNLLTLNAATTTSYEHANIFEVPSVRDLLASIITNAPNNELPQYIETAQPTYHGTAPRRYFLLHSPLTLGFTDSLGNYTGALASSSAVFNIPGVEYQRFGEVQWLSIPKSLAGQVVMRGMGNGSFVLDIKEIDGNTVVATTTFAAIASATSTVATLAIAPGISPANEGALVVDLNGDGTHKTTYHAKLDAVVLPDIVPPATNISLTGTRGQNGWFTSTVTAKLMATDTESGVKETSFSVDGAATTTGTVVSIAAEGVHAVSYYSTDNAGNREVSTTTIIKIDKTPPEVTLLVSTTTKDMFAIGSDNLSSTTVKSVSTSITVTDLAGNVTTLNFQKTYTGGILTYARLASVQYGTSTPISLPTSFVYLWNPLISPPILLSQTVVVDSTFGIEAMYDKSKSKTTIIVKKKGTSMQNVTVSGLAIIKLTTNKGTVSYSW